MQKGGFVFVTNGNIELVEHVSQQLLKGGIGMIDKDGFYLFIKIVEQGVDEGGLTGTHFPGDGDKPFSFLDPIHHGSKRLSVTGSQIEKLRVRLKELERQVKINEENYQLYVKHMEEARISNAMDNQKLANISVVEPALPPIKPVKPNKLLNIILSIFLGGFAGLGVAFSSEYFSHSFNNGEDVKKHLDLPVFASIPEM